MQAGHETVFNPAIERSSFQKPETKELLADVKSLSAEKLHQSIDAANAASLLA